MKAIVVGGGIGGLTTAIALRRVGIDARVFERRPDLTDALVGGGVVLWHNATKALQQLDLADRVQAVGSPIERSQYRSWRSGTLADWPVGEMGRKLGAPAIGVSRADLQTVLAETLDDGALQLRARCTGFEQDERGVTVRFAGGGEKRADLLIGTDGSHSLIRAALGETRPGYPPYAGYTIWHAIIEFDLGLAPPGLFCHVLGRGTRFIFYRVGGHRLYLLCIEHGPAGGRDVEGERKRALLSRYRGWQKPIEAILRATDESAISRMDIFGGEPLKCWGRGRVTLLGDAAHPMTTILGQGAGMAIEDAVVLTKCLTAHTDVAAALRAYEARRRPRTTAIMERARRIGRISRVRNPLACALRDRLMRLMLNAVTWRQHAREVGYEV